MGIMLTNLNPEIQDLSLMNKDTLLGLIQAEDWGILEYYLIDNGEDPEAFRKHRRHFLYSTSYYRFREDAYRLQILMPHRFIWIENHKYPFTNYNSVISLTLPQEKGSFTYIENKFPNSKKKNHLREGMEVWYEKQSLLRRDLLLLLLKENWYG